jgi:type IV secretion system protein VirB1
MATFETLAAKCAAGVALDLLVALASVQSGVHPLAVRNGATLTRVGSAGEGVALAVGAVDQGREPRVGLMGLTERQLRSAGLTLADGFEACVSLSVAAAIIEASRGSPAVPKSSAESADRAALRAWWRAGGQFASVAALETAIARERAHATVLVKREVAPSPPKAPEVPPAASGVAAVEGPSRAVDRRPASVEPDCWDVFARQRAALAQCEDPVRADATEPRVRSHQPETASVVMSGSRGTPR